MNALNRVRGIADREMRKNATSFAMRTRRNSGMSVCLMPRRIGRVRRWETQQRRLAEPWKIKLASPEGASIFFPNHRYWLPFLTKFIYRKR